MIDEKFSKEVLNKNIFNSSTFNTVLNWLMFDQLILLLTSMQRDALVTNKQKFERKCHHSGYDSYVQNRENRATSLDT